MEFYSGKNMVREVIVVLAMFPLAVKLTAWVFEGFGEIVTFFYIPTFWLIVGWKSAKMIRDYEYPELNPKRMRLSSEQPPSQPNP